MSPMTITAYSRTGRQPRSTSTKRSSASSVSIAKMPKPLLAIGCEEDSSNHLQPKDDPHRSLKGFDSRYSENYHQDRHFVQSLTKEFLIGNSNPPKHTPDPTRSDSDQPVHQATFNSSSLRPKTSESLEPFTGRDLINLPFLSHAGSVVKIHRTKCPKRTSGKSR
uniref:Uncharacterized protein n=1 Tax=Euplotes harpa TaxID=151035 RepID=A0A7S3JAX7_9SPIT|mmetsp:Transcript_30154/g.34513  ORF Transcript_30154/g.34513 Transcript_30154/m.34513 type:complete len:165 (+) Transcript_30154:305-799(+)